MIKKSFFVLTAAVAVAMLFASCEKYDHAISDIEDRLDKIESASLTTIDQQIAAINASINDLKAMDTELGGYISALQTTAADLQSQIDATNTALAALESDLEGQITASEQKVLDELNTVKTTLEGELTTINNTIATLQAKDAELDQKIADLQKYVDDEITATEDWASATFSTLEQYEATQTAISEINALITSTQESITALEEKLSKKIDDDIAAAVAGVNADVAAKVKKITYAYTTAIANAKTEIEAAYTDAIKTAITASEISMKDWVNGVLAEGYYKKAEIDGKITALATQVTEGDDALQKEIDALETALAKAESDLTAAYTKAIEEAITKNNGKITAEITAAVKTAQDNLQAQIDTINIEIEKIKARLDIIEADINTINQQIAAINGSIDDLKAMDTELGGYISALQTTAADLQSQIDATNTALAALESDLEGQITASEQKVLDELNTVKTTLEGELTTINNTIATLQAKDAELDQKIADLQKYVDDEITATEDWASATFATLAQYQEVQTTIAGIKSDITAINTAMADLETRINNKIATDIKAAIDALRAELGADYTAKIEAATNAVTSAYTDAIATAKTEIEAAYTKDIADAIAASETSMKAWVNGKLQEVYAEIADVQADLAALAASVATDEELAAAVAAQQTILNQAKSDLTAAYKEAIKKAIEDNNGLVSKEIADAVKAATETFNTKIDAINAEIESIKTEIALMKESIGALEDKFASRIQSIRFLPEYSDGKVEFTSTNPTAELTFLISPSNLAAKIATAYRNNTSVVTAYLSLTQERTRAVGTPTQINVTGVTGANGVLTVKVNTENVPANWATANLFIRISDGNNDVISEMIPAIYSCELPDGNTFRYEVHDQLANDTKAIKFIANSKVVTQNQIGTSPAYMRLNGTTLEIHTAAKEFIFNSDCYSMFSNFDSNGDLTKFANITTIDFNDCINTSKVESMGHMFRGCEALESLDLSSFNTANVTNMKGMFYRCMTLESLDLSGFDTANVTDMSSMFFQCVEIESLNLSSFDTAKVTDMSDMFHLCGALESLDLSNFDTANVKNMKSMFSFCEALESLYLSNFDTANVTNMKGMFYMCKTLESLDLSGFDTANVTDMSSMFFECKALESLDLSDFDTANVTDMTSMFSQCVALKSLDIRKFNMEKVTNRNYMFSNVGKLYYEANNTPTPIKVSGALNAILLRMNVSPGDYAIYRIVSIMPS